MATGKWPPSAAAGRREPPSAGLTRSGAVGSTDPGLTGSRGVRSFSESGRLQHRSIPGYTGFVPGRTSEDVHAASHGRASILAKEAVAKRSLPPVDSKPEALTRTALSLDVGATGKTSTSRSLLSTNDVGSAQVVSIYHNPRGLGHRSGSNIPGYTGHIPGKIAGGMCSKRYAMDNLNATAHRAMGLEVDCSWHLHAEHEKRVNHHGALRTGVTTPWRSISVPSEAPRRSGTLSKGEWTLYEPKATHEWISY